jgi:hypothetical protein
VIANFKEAYKLGFLAAYGDGSKNFAAHAPNSWAITRMMWDPERDTTGLMNDYYRSAYGPVANEMKAFFETYNTALNENWAKRRRLVDTSGIAYANVITSWRTFYPVSVVEKAESHLRAAEKAAPPGEYAERVAFHRFAQDYTAMMLDLLETYRLICAAGIKVGLAPVDLVETSEADREKLLKRAFELGEKRETMLLAHRNWAAMDEGLYGFTNDAKLRQWHSVVKAELKIDRPTAITKAQLQGK